MFFFGTIVRNPNIHYCYYFNLDAGKLDGVAYGPIIEAVISSVIGIAIITGFCVCLFTCIIPNFRGRPIRPSKVYVHGSFACEYDVSNLIFISGTFASYYCHNNEYHGPFDMKLGFYPSARDVVHGRGKDDIGTYIITGIYSARTLRMSLKKHYQFGTENPNANLDQVEKIQVKWNHSNQQFEGKYYRRTELDHNENKFIIRYEGADG